MATLRAQFNWNVALYLTADLRGARSDGRAHPHVEHRCRTLRYAAGRHR